VKLKNNVKSMNEYHNKFDLYLYGLKTFYWNHIFMDEISYHASPLRSSIEEILNEHELVASQKLFGEIFGSITGVSAVINNNRQIVFANNDFIELLGLTRLEQVLGKRLGEVVSCIHADSEQMGCGTSMACRYCGAVNAIIESQLTNKKSIKETSISSLSNGQQVSWELNISSTPITLADRVFYVINLQDISNEKKLKTLERIFFHDLLNTASGLNGLLTILKMGAYPDEVPELIARSEEASQEIIDEIALYRKLRAAEKGDIEVKIETGNSIALIESAIARISSHEVGKNKHIIIEEDSADIEFQTDKILLQRVIINLLKNALEATQEGGFVTAGINATGDKIRFMIKNAGVMSHDVQVQIFQRSFSTKDIGRGIGAYSIRLLTENYLKGKVSFVSNEIDGTIFTIEIPR
jgi:nitrogen-specific signal transduction histidine kinase